MSTSPPPSDTPDPLLGSTPAPSNDTPEDPSVAPSDAPSPSPAGAPSDATPPPVIEHIFRWDLDKTYLQTDFDRVRDLVRTALQSAEEKKNVPGALPLLRALIKQASGPNARRALYIVSGSPNQMRKVLERKLELDGFKPDGFVLKPNLENLLKLRFRAIKGQVGYKLRALLEHQVASHLGPIPETLFGDDAEQDAIIYSIYAEVVAGRIRGDALKSLLTTARAYPHNIDAILAASELIEPAERVRRIIIRLDRKSPTERFRPFAPLLVPIYNYFQAALILFQDGLISDRDVILISQHMLTHDGYDITSLANSFQDVLRRRVLSLSTVSLLASSLQHLADANPNDPIAHDFLSQFAERLSDLNPPPESTQSTPSAPPNYLEILQRELSARHPHTP
jgi:hypothetical protein